MNSKSIYYELMVFHDILACHDLSIFLLVDSTCNVFAGTSSVKYSNGFCLQNQIICISMFLFKKEAISLNTRRKRGNCTIMKHL